MDLTSNNSRAIYIDPQHVVETEEARLPLSIIYSIILILASIFYEFIFIFLENRNPKIDFFLPIVMDFLRSIIIGMIASMLIINFYIETVNLSNLSTLGYLINYSPFIILPFVFLIVASGIYFVRKCKNRSKKYRKLSDDVEMTSFDETPVISISEIKQIPKREIFTEYYSHSIYLSLAFFHSFFIGFGFNSLHYFGCLK